MSVALAAVIALAAVTLRLLRRRMPAGSPSLRVVARLPLEPRRTLYVVQAAGKLLLVGVGDGPMSLVAELDPARAGELAQDPAADPSLLALVKRALGRGETEA